MGNNKSCMVQKTGFFNFEQNCVFRIKMLDAIRYLVVWNPVVFFLVHLFLHFSGIEDRLKDSTVTHVEVVEVVA